MLIFRLPYIMLSAIDILLNFAIIRPHGFPNSASTEVGNVICNRLEVTKAHGKSNSQANTTQT